MRDKCKVNIILITIHNKRIYIAAAVQTDSSTVNKQITTILTSQANKRVNVSLSEGPDYNNYQQNVLVKVRDTLGGSQIYNCGTVVVSVINKLFDNNPRFKFAIT